MKIRETSPKKGLVFFVLFQLSLYFSRDL